jgi:hypothetical protein
MAKKPDNLGALEAAILEVHDCWPTHRGTIFVTEKTEEGEMIWEGPVELFGLAGHEIARNCYAWQYPDIDGRTKILIVLENEIIDSARKAVQGAIFRGFQPPRQKHTKGLELLKKSLQQSDQTFHEAQIKTEDLDAAIQALKETRKMIYRKRETKSFLSY